MQKISLLLQTIDFIISAATHAERRALMPSIHWYRYPPRIWSFRSCLDYENLISLHTYIHTYIHENLISLLTSGTLFRLWSRHFCVTQTLNTSFQCDSDSQHIISSIFRHVILTFTSTTWNWYSPILMSWVRPVGLNNVYIHIYMCVCVYMYMHI